MILQNIEIHLTFLKPNICQRRLPISLIYYYFDCSTAPRSREGRLPQALLPSIVLSRLSRHENENCNLSTAERFSEFFPDKLMNTRKRNNGDARKIRNTGKNTK